MPYESKSWGSILLEVDTRKTLKRKTVHLFFEIEEGKEVRPKSEHFCNVALTAVVLSTLTPITVSNEREVKFV